MLPLGTEMPLVSPVSLVELMLVLLFAVIALVLLAQKINIPYPIPLVIGGLLLSLIPGLPPVHLNPDLVFVMFLPPLLYSAGLMTSWRDFRANLRPILLLVVGALVLWVRRRRRARRSSAPEMRRPGALRYCRYSRRS